MKTTNSKAQIDWKFTLSLLLGFMLFSSVIYISFTAAGQLFNVQDSTTNKFNEFSNEIRSLIADESPFVVKERLPMSITDDYAIVGYDSGYQPVPLKYFATGLGDFDNIAEGFTLIEKSQLDISLVDKPESCGVSACLCLVNFDSGISKCEPLGDGEIVIAGKPFIDPDGGYHWIGKSVNTFFNSIKETFTDKEPNQYPYQNSGASRFGKYNSPVKKDTNLEKITKLKSFGYNEEWIEPYGYLILSHESYYARAIDQGYIFGARNVYIEKLKVDNVNYILVIPEGNTPEYDDNIGRRFIDRRKELYQEILTSKKDTLLKNIETTGVVIDESKKVSNSQGIPINYDKLNPEYLKLFQYCSEFKSLYSATPVPVDCSWIKVCSAPEKALSDLDCNIESTMPCICESTNTDSTNVETLNSQVCSDRNNFCYESGCTGTESKGTTCGWN